MGKSLVSCFFLDTVYSNSSSSSSSSKILSEFHVLEFYHVALPVYLNNVANDAKYH